MGVLVQAERVWSADVRNDCITVDSSTHGLFPYRGKFHPQMVRGILNAVGVGPGDTVLDPMMGSGTVPIEASLMGIDAIGVDISPFCVFMTETKTSGLTMALQRAEGALTNIESTFD